MVRIKVEKVNPVHLPLSSEMNNGLIFGLQLSARHIPSALTGLPRPTTQSSCLAGKLAAGLSQQATVLL